MGEHRKWRFPYPWGREPTPDSIPEHTQVDISDEQAPAGSRVNPTVVGSSVEGRSESVGVGVEQAEPVEWCRCAPDECIARFDSPEPDDCRHAFLYTHPPASDERLRKALKELADYTEVILTGPVVSEVIQWPDDFPDCHPQLSAARAALGTQEPEA